jgi:hypothetical protein
MRTRKAAPGQREVRIKVDRSFVKTNRFLDRINGSNALTFSRQTPQISIVGFGIAGRFRAERLLLVTA